MESIYAPNPYSQNPVSWRVLLQVYIYIYIYITCIRMCTNTVEHMPPYTHMHTHMPTDPHTYMHTCILVYIYTYTYVYIHIHTDIHMCIYIYRYTDALALLCQGLGCPRPVRQIGHCQASPSRRPMGCPLFGSTLSSKGYQGLGFRERGIYKGMSTYACVHARRNTYIHMRIDLCIYIHAYVYHMYICTDGVRGLPVPSTESSHDYPAGTTLQDATAIVTPAGSRVRPPT